MCAETSRILFLQTAFWIVWGLHVLVVPDVCNSNVVLSRYLAPTRGSAMNTVFGHRMSVRDKLCSYQWPHFKPYFSCVEIKCQLDATDDFYCRSYCLFNMFRAPLCPSSGAREYCTEGCCLWYLVLWFSSCRYGVELRVVCLVCGLLAAARKPDTQPSSSSFPVCICFWFFYFSAFLLSWLWFFNPRRPSKRQKRRKNQNSRRYILSWRLLNHGLGLLQQNKKWFDWYFFNYLCNFLYT